MLSKDLLTPTLIRKSPGVCGGDARIRETRHSVAGLVVWRRLGLSDEKILGRLPDLSPADLEAAWTYYAEHVGEVDGAICEQEDA